MTRGAKIALAAIAVIAAAQAVPMARTNPAVTADVGAPPAVAAALRRACYDCHSNETRWPWYSRVAPVSWLVHSDVVEGRRHLNFSEWDKLTPERRTRKRSAIREVIEGDDMPPAIYRPMHAEARLADADKQAIARWASEQATAR